ncbi:CLUMA_CG005213, isoform D [Clunio marinus]|uniref:CLUMA_CG005213, isoform D n=1 Tax=Clunio marinus TaxID=568069 RepID=A0A1J1HYE8_9DIPT|nr:CLUMA_CG005213, isoform D [Clunio marinus]
MMASEFDPVLSKLLTSLNEADNKLSGEQELQFLQSLLQSKEINALVNVHHKVAKIGKDDRIAPVLSASMQVALEILELLAPRCHISPVAKELFHLLQTPHLQSLMCAHDAVAQKDFYPHLPEIPVEMDEDEETIKIVQLVKSNEPLVRKFFIRITIFLNCLHISIHQ